MKRFKQFTSFLISDFTTNVWTHPRHNHNHYELIFIEKGAGKHKINKNEIAYEKGALFLLGPDDSHEFEIENETRFIYCKFTLDFFKEDNELIAAESLPLYKTILDNREIRNAKIKLSKNDQDLLSKQFAVVSDLQNAGHKYERILFFQLISILEVLENYTSISSKETETQSLKRGMEPVLNYIHNNIYYPKNLRLSHLAQEFNTTKNYFGKFFKRNMKVPLREYLLQYKLQLIKNRLSNGNYTKREIATEFGFTDESHLLKTLKKHPKSAKC
ncbi:transcriptional regulator, AraC family [Zunongwangia mangrovi]|uniref:Transcriptional regulator, AraC family n=1 Tax=Zunongwangia mangrovi TaxID=1334022 RepID=A0A1I1M6K6_9FLAO|nr:AraC family transcriptional regulator [Zunongwangia mangrovi]SFC80855.1 transcriptional regulator, AraC family [Zunongwangia mangrovi]